MAKTRRTRKTATPRRSWSLIVVLLFVILVGGFYLLGAPFTKDVQAATAYTARVACSCRFVAGRDLHDCEKDKIAGMEWVGLSEDVEARSVTASIPFVASDTATLRDGYGCVLQPWQREG